MTHSHGCASFPTRLPLSEAVLTLAKSSRLHFRDGVSSLEPRRESNGTIVAGIAPVVPFPTPPPPAALPPPFPPPPPRPISRAPPPFILPAPSSPILLFPPSSELVTVYSCPPPLSDDTLPLLGEWRRIGSSACAYPELWCVHRGCRSPRAERFPGLEARSCGEETVLLLRRELVIASFRHELDRERGVRAGGGLDELLSRDTWRKVEPANERLRYLLSSRRDLWRLHIRRSSE